MRDLIALIKETGLFVMEPARGLEQQLASKYMKVALLTIPLGRLGGGGNKASCYLYII